MGREIWSTGMSAAGYIALSGTHAPERTEDPDSSAAGARPPMTRNRPLGWLKRATPDELALALSEGEWVRTRWGDEARPVHPES